MKKIALWLLVVVGLGLVAGGVSSRGAAPDGLEVTYIANEGVLVASGDAQVLIDGLHRPYSPMYAVLPPAQRESIETARPPFDEIDVILVSHVHRDHFHAEAVGRHLQHNPEAQLIASEQVADSLAQSFTGYESIRARILPVKPAWKERIVLRMSGIEIDVLGLQHGSRRFRWVQNLGHIVTLDGKKLLHLGDADVSVENFEAFKLADEGIDVAFIPYWFLESATGRAIVRDVIKPKQVVTVHIPPEEAAQATQKTRAFDPKGIAFTKMLESRVYGR